LVPQTREVWFDLSSEVSWLAGEVVRQFVFERGTLAIEAARVEAELPILASDLAPRVQGADWRFDGDNPRSASCRMRLLLFDLTSFALHSLAVERTEDGGLLARTAQATVARMRAAGSQHIVWTLEALVGDHPLARNHARLGPP
jgi:hypothetical protein